MSEISSDVHAAAESGGRLGPAMVTLLEGVANLAASCPGPASRGMLELALDHLKAAAENLRYALENWTDS